MNQLHAYNINKKHLIYSVITIIVLIVIALSIFLLLPLFHKDTFTDELNIALVERYGKFELIESFVLEKDNKFLDTVCIAYTENSGLVFCSVRTNFKGDFIGLTNFIENIKIGTTYNIQEHNINYTIRFQIYQNKDDIPKNAYKIIEIFNDEAVSYFCLWYMDIFVDTVTRDLIFADEEYLNCDIVTAFSLEDDLYPYDKIYVLSDDTNIHCIMFSIDDYSFQYRLQKIQNLKDGGNYFATTIINDYFVELKLFDSKSDIPTDNCRIVEFMHGDREMYLCISDITEYAVSKKTKQAINVLYGECRLLDLFYVGIDETNTELICIFETSDGTIHADCLGTYDGETFILRGYDGVFNTSGAISLLFSDHDYLVILGIANNISNIPAETKMFSMLSTSKGDVFLYVKIESPIPEVLTAMQAQ